MFWKFLWPLALASIVVPLIIGLALWPVFGVLYVLFGRHKEGEKTPEWTYPLFVVVALSFLYLSCGWSAFAAYRAVRFAAMPEVSWDWLYYLTGFFLLIGPFAYMAADAPNDKRDGSCLFTLAAALAYVLFCIWPRLMTAPYGWMIRLFFGDDALGKLLR
jgi:hypothetical protein